MDDQRVLIIETDAALQRMLVGTIRTRGYPYLLVNSAEEALVALEENDFFFTLVNLCLDGGDGRPLLRSLRIQGGDPGALIGFARASQDTGDPEAAALSLDGFIRAPFTTVFFRRAVHARPSSADQPTPPKPLVSSRSTRR